MKKILYSLFALFLTFGVCCACGSEKCTHNKDGQAKVKYAGEKTMTEAKEVRASHILVESKAEALEIKKLIEDGAAFSEMAAKYSSCPSGKDGGDLGYFQKGQMVKEFETAAFTLPLNQVSEPVKTQFGWHLIEVTGKK